MIGEIKMYCEEKLQGGKKATNVCVGTVPFECFSIYALFVTVATWTDAIFFWGGIKNGFYGVAAVLTILFLLWYARFHKVSFREYRVSKLFWAECAVIILLTFMRGLIPDTGFDTLNYHLLSQAPFRHGFEGNCAPGNFQLYGFALGDKLYTLPRLIFGYRAGSMFSGIILCLALYQVSELLHLLCGERLASLRAKYFSGPVTRYFSFVLQEETWAFLAVFVHDSVMLLGSYYVELFALPFLLECVYQILSPEPESPQSAVHFILCGGFLFAIKMTNIVFLLPMIILYLIKIRKIVKPGLFFLCLVVGFFPSAPYLLVNWVEYGNPVFPYYNTIFKSPYFPETDFKDGRFGPQTLLETLLWPLYMIFAPDYRQTEIAMWWTGGLAVGMASVLATVVVLAKRIVHRAKVSWQVLSLCVLVAVSFVLWEVTTSISRYYLGGYILLTCLFVWFCTHYLLGKTRPQSILGILCCALVVWQPISVFQEYQQGREWSWRMVTWEAVNENIVYLFRDRVPQTSPEEGPAAYFVIDNSTGIAQVLSPDTPIYRMEYLYDTLEGDIQQGLIQETDAILQEGNAYLLSNSQEFGENTVEKLNQYGLYVENISVVQNTVFSTVRDVLTMSVSSLKENQVNTLYTTPFSLPWNGEKHLTAQCYAPDYQGTLYLQLKDDTGDVVYMAPLNEDGTLALSIDLPQIESKNLEWGLVDDRGIPVEENGPTFMVLNPQFSG